MYLILNSKKLITEICERPCFVRRQTNGVVILSDEARADAIYSNDSDTFWPIKPVGYLCESHTLLEVDSVPESVVAGYYFYSAGEYYTTEANLTALAKAEAPDIAGLVFVKMAEGGEFDDTTLAEHALQFAEWTYPVNYTVGQIRKRNGKLYRCLQDHTSQESWTPEDSPSLWVNISDPAEEWPEWSQPIGATDAYALGAKVSHNGKHWTSSYDNNVWEPGVYGWEEVV